MLSFSFRCQGPSAVSAGSFCSCPEISCPGSCHSFHPRLCSVPLSVCGSDMCTQQVVGVCVSGVPVGMNQCLLALGGPEPVLSKEFSCGISVTLVLRLRSGNNSVSHARCVCVCLETGVPGNCMVLITCINLRIRGSSYVLRGIHT